MRDRNLSVEKNDKPSTPGEYVTPMDPTAMFLGSSFWTAINSYSWVLKFDQQSTHGTQLPLRLGLMLNYYFQM